MTMIDSDTRRMPDTSFSNLRLLNQFYRVFFILVLVLLFIGVPFVFERKATTLALTLAMLGLVGICWRMARRGQPERSLLIFAATVWLGMASMLFLGLPGITSSFMLAVAVMLSVVVGHRIGQLYAAGYMLAWFAYLMLDHFGLAPPHYFPGTTYSPWFVSVVAIWLVLLPIPELIAQMRASMARAEDEVARRAAVEAELVSAHDAALVASRAKSEFLASMSHELRTPLNAILGFSQLMCMDPNLHPDAKEQVGEIGRAGKHLLALINDLMDMSRIEAGKLELSMKPVPVADVVSESISLMTHIAGKQGIEIKREVGDDGTAIVCADYTRLRQIVLNLISNAIKYNRPQGSVTLTCRRVSGTLRISVVDTGPGIPVDKQGRIFNAFDRLGEECSNVEGTGIGLVISKRLVEAMGGMIGFESIEGQGSTFWVQFPVTEAVAPAVPEEPVVPEEPAVAMVAEPQTSRSVVLYIEDNPANLQLMLRIFSNRPDLDLRHAHTAELGIELARTELPALIMMDINLPGIDGYEALNILKADPATARIPVIAVSANAMKGDEERGLAAGFIAYLVKPIDIPSLFQCLDRVMNKSAV